MTYKELIKIIDDYKLQKLEKFYDEFRDYDTSKFQDIYIKVHDTLNNGFEIVKYKLPKDDMTLENIVDYLWELQEDNGGSWQFEATIGVDNYVWFEISETLFDYDWY
jgi:hypothetical protein